MDEDDIQMAEDEMQQKQVIQPKKQSDIKLAKFDIEPEFVEPGIPTAFMEINIQSEETKPKPPKFPNAFSKPNLFKKAEAVVKSTKSKLSIFQTLQKQKFVEKQPDTKQAAPSLDTEVDPLDEFMQSINSSSIPQQVYRPDNKPQVVTLEDFEAEVAIASEELEDES